MTLKKTIILVLLVFIIIGTIVILVYSIAIRDILLTIASLATLITLVYGTISIREELKNLR